MVVCSGVSVHACKSAVKKGKNYANILRLSADFKELNGNKFDQRSFFIGF